MSGRDHAADVADSLTSMGPFSVLDALCIKYKRAGRSAMLCCPFHGDSNPSASFRVGAGGTLQLRCHSACARSWDVHGVVAQAFGLDVQRDFRRVLIEGAKIAGLHDVVDELERRDGTPREIRIREHNAAPPPERPYPPISEVDSLWSMSVPVTADAEALAYFSARGLDPVALDRLDLVRIIRAGVRLPRWAGYKGDADHSRSWAETGHRAIVSVVDSLGVVRSVRAIRILPGNDLPKRLPASGWRASGLVMANSAGIEMLRLGPAYGAGGPVRVVVAEGEPDFLSDAVAWSVPVIGIVSGSWTGDMASRIPDGATVILRTDHDRAGDGYAREIAMSIAHRCSVLRSSDPGSGLDENDRLKAGTLPAAPDADAAPMPAPPRSGLDGVLLGSLFRSYGWVGPKVKRASWAVRCPSEHRHADGSRFDGSTVLVANDGDEVGAFRCEHPECSGIYRSWDMAAKAMARVARAEGL